LRAMRDAGCENRHVQRFVEHRVGRDGEDHFTHK
jgi:hypothetical protein